MLPSLIRRFMMGSMRESAMDMPPLLRGGFPPLMKALTAAFRRCSSSNSAFLFRRKKKNAPAAMAAATTTPTTTPTAIPTMFEFDFLGVGFCDWAASVGVADAVSS